MLQPLKPLLVFVLGLALSTSAQNTYMVIPTSQLGDLIHAKGLVLGTPTTLRVRSQSLLSPLELQPTEILNNTLDYRDGA